MICKAQNGEEKLVKVFCHGRRKYKDMTRMKISTAEVLRFIFDSGQELISFLSCLEGKNKT